MCCVLWVCCLCSYLFAAELPRGGKGTPTSYTGLIWGGFRPSDDAQVIAAAHAWAAHAGHAHPLCQQLPYDVSCGLHDVQYSVHEGSDCSTCGAHCNSNTSLLGRFFTHVHKKPMQTHCRHQPFAPVQKYGYNIPANMYAAGALRRLLVLNAATWGSEEVKERATMLLDDIKEGLAKWGTTKAPDGSTVYAYEVCKTSSWCKAGCIWLG